jgi:hypothetical protein
MPERGYIYSALSAEHCEIRLLTLAPGGREEAIQCHLSVATLTDQPSYTALSYVWGSPVASVDASPEILLDGHHFPVTSNLHAALQHLRPSDGHDSIALWVDAVSINQSDVEERNQQVAMMRNIYASATDVTIWLGEEDEVSVAAFDAFPIIADKTSWFWQGKDNNNSLRHQQILKHCGDFFFSLQSEYPWFTRVWILQELALASEDPMVVCGWKSTPWSMFIAAWQAIAQEPSLGLVNLQKEWKAPSGESHFVALTKLDVLSTLRQSTQDDTRESLKRLLIMSRTSAATDPRDRVYGLLGLLDKNALDPDLSTPIPVDYRKSCAEVYTDAMRHIFSQGDGPYFLSGVYLSGRSVEAPHIASLPASTEQPTLPSWVPDFTLQTAETAWQPTGLAFLPPATMTASGAGQGAKNGTILEDRRTLQIEGLFVDIMDEVIPLGSTLETFVESLPELEAMTKAAREKPCHFQPPIAAQMHTFRTSEPLWRILISNKNFKAGYEAAPPSYEDTYLTYLGAGSTQDKLSQELDDALKPEYELALRACIGRKSLFTTDNGFVGTCVPRSRKGDVIAIVFGSPAPFVLRRLMEEGEGVYSLVGTCYTGGIMNGEMVDELYCEDRMDSTRFLIR